MPIPRQLVLAAGSVAFAIVSSCPAHAADAAPGAFKAVPVGGVGIDQADIVLDEGAVRTTIWTAAPRQGAGDAPTPALRLDLPRFGWIGGGMVARAAPDLKLTVDGSGGKVKESAFAYFGDTDITGQLDAAGLDSLAVGAAAPLTKPAGGAQVAFEKLVALGAIASSGDGYHARWSAAPALIAPIGAKDRHRVILTYAARPVTSPVARGQIATAVPWADYCLTVEAAVRFADQLAPGDVLTARRYEFPVAIDQMHPKTVEMTVQLPKDAHDLVAFCGYLGRAAVNPDRPVAAGVSDQGIVKLIVLGAAPKN